MADIAPGAQATTVDPGGGAAASAVSPAPPATPASASPPAEPGFSDAFEEVAATEKPSKPTAKAGAAKTAADTPPAQPPTGAPAPSSTSATEPNPNAQPKGDGGEKTAEERLLAVLKPPAPAAASAETDEAYFAAVTAKHPNFADLRQDPGLVQWLQSHPEMAAKARPDASSADTIAVLDAYVAAKAGGGGGAAAAPSTAVAGNSSPVDVPAEVLGLKLKSGLSVADMVKDAPEWVELPVSVVETRAPAIAERAIAQAIATGRVVAKPQFDALMNELRALKTDFGLLAEHPDAVRIERTAEFKAYLEQRPEAKAAWGKGEHKALILDAYKEAGASPQKTTAARREEAAARRSSVSASLNSRPASPGRSVEKTFMEAFNDAAA